jgi:hypothetical protein
MERALDETSALKNAMTESRAALTRVEDAFTRVEAALTRVETTLDRSLMAQSDDEPLA